MIRFKWWLNHRSRFDLTTKRFDLEVHNLIWIWIELIMTWFMIETNQKPRVVYDLRPNDHIMPKLKALHWLPVKQRIELNLCLLVYLVIDKRTPTESPDNYILHPCPVKTQTARPATTMLSSSQPNSNLVNAPSPLPDPASGFNCLPTLKPSHSMF